MKKVFTYLIFTIVFMAGIVTGKTIYDKPCEDVPKEQIIQALTFEDSVYTYILELNIQHPDIVFRQARIESGNFKSRVFLENNNMFGMKIPSKRPNMVSGSNRGYAVYNSWQESVIDYALYQAYSGKNLTKEDYVKMLNNSYAEDVNYLNKLLK